MRKFINEILKQCTIHSVMVRFCSKFGHRWQYSFTCSDSMNKETNIRRCKTCGEIQHYKQIASFNPNGEWVWMKAIIYTKFGAKKRWTL